MVTYDSWNKDKSLILDECRNDRELFVAVVCSAYVNDYLQWLVDGKSNTTKKH